MNIWINIVMPFFGGGLMSFLLSRLAYKQGYRHGWQAAVERMTPWV